MAIEDDIAVDGNGNFRWDGGDVDTMYPVIEFHRHISACAARAEGPIDITSGAPSVRITDEMIILNAPYNIDEELARHLCGGSISQEGGKTIYVSSVDLEHCQLAGRA